MTTGTLKFNLDQQIASWFEDVRRRDLQLDAVAPPTICLSRKFGCEAYPLAMLLKEKLDSLTFNKWHIFDKAILDKLRTEESLSAGFLNNLGDYSRIVDRYMHFLKDDPSHDDAMELLSRHIMSIAINGHAIIIGRGSAILTKDLPNCFRFRLEASFPYRVASIARRSRMNEKNAELYVKENENVRERFIESFVGASVTDFNAYHAVFNNEFLTLEQISDSIVSMVVQPDEAKKAA